MKKYNDKIQYIDIPIPETSDIERQVIVDMIIYPDAMGELSPMVHPDFFSNDDRKAIWKTIESRYNMGEDFGQVTIHQIFRETFQREILPFMGKDLGRMAIYDHVAMLRRGAASRRAYFSAAEYMTKVVNPATTEQDIINAAENLVRIAEGPVPALAVKNLGEAVTEFREEAKAIEAAAAEGKTLRIGTGFKKIDMILNGGFRRGQVVILAARPGVGKTSVMLHIAKNAAINGFPVYINTIEMTTEELGEKAVYSTGRVRPLDVSTARVDWEQFDAAEAELNGLPILINQDSRTLDDIVGRISQAVKQGKCSMAMIDYLGLIQDTSDLGRNDTQSSAIGNVMKTLKSASKRLGIPIVLLCQLNRESVRNDRHPQLYDLRDSGNIEQDADIVLMLEYDSTRRGIIAWLRKSRNGKRQNDKGEEFGFVLYPNDTYSAFEEGDTIGEKDTPVEPLARPLPEPVTTREDEDETLPF